MFSFFPYQAKRLAWGNVSETTYFVLMGRNTTTQSVNQPWHHGLSVLCWLSVGHDYESFPKAAEPVDMPFRMCSHVDPRNHGLCRGPDPQGKQQFYGAPPGHLCSTADSIVLVINTHHCVCVV